MQKQSERRLWLAVPHDARQAARQAAGVLADGRSAIAWDREARLWYARMGCPLARIQAYLPQTVVSRGGGDAQAEFHDALTQAGLLLDGVPVMDGQRHRVATIEDKKGRKSGVYRGFLDRRPGGWFINYHRAENDKAVTNWTASGGERDPLARLHLRAAARQSQDDAQRQREALSARQTARARTLYDALPAADPAHPYLVRKGISPTPSLRQTQNGALVVPFFDTEGTFRTLQYITPSGDKRLYRDAPKQGHFLVVGDALRDGEPLLFAEGYATARSLNLATGRTVVMTIDAGNMLAVARRLTARYPASPAVFMADVDHGKARNTGLLMAERAAALTGGRVCSPAFSDEERRAGLTDYNDLHQSRGLAGLRAQLPPGLLTHQEITMQEPLSSPDAPVTPASDDAPGPILPEVQNNAAAPDAASLSRPRPPLPDGHEQESAGGGETASVPDQDVERDDVDPAAVAAYAAWQSQPAALSRRERPAPAGENPDRSSKIAETSDDTPVSAPEAAVDAIQVGPPRPGMSAAEPDASLIDRDALLQRLSWEKQADNTVLYTLDASPAFIDRGSRLEMADGASESDEKVLAALLTAAHYYRGRIELTGSAAFQQKAITLLARYALDVTMKVPAQQAMLEEAKRALTTAVTPGNAITGDTVPAAGAFAAPPVDTPVVPTTACDPPPASAAMTAQAPVNPTSPAPAGVDAGQPAAGISPAIHQRYQAAAEGITGKVLACGEAPFRFETGQPPSVFITLRTREGKQTFWEKELAGLLREQRIQPGHLVTLTWQGKVPVDIKVPHKNPQGVVTHYTSKTGHRHQWALRVSGSDRVRSGDDAGVRLAAFDAARFATIQATLARRLGLTLPPAPVPADGLYWLRPNGQGSPTSGDPLSAPRPPVDGEAGQPVISSWGEDGRPDLYLVRSDGPYLQGIVRHQDQYQPVLVTLPGRPDAPPMVFNRLTPDGAMPIGCGNGINRSGGQPVARESVAFRLEGDRQARIGKLDAPATLPPALHARLGFDERWREENASPKNAPAAAPRAQQGAPRPL